MRADRTINVCVFVSVNIVFARTPQLTYAAHYIHTLYVHRRIYFSYEYSKIAPLNVVFLLISIENKSHWIGNINSIHDIVRLYIFDVCGFCSIELIQTNNNINVYVRWILMVDDKVLESFVTDVIWRKYIIHMYLYIEGFSYTNAFAYISQREKYLGIYYMCTTTTRWQPTYVCIWLYAHVIIWLYIKSVYIRMIFQRMQIVCIHIYTSAKSIINRFMWA